MGWVDAQRYITGRPNVEIITRARRRYQYHPWRMGSPRGGPNGPTDNFFSGGAWSPKLPSYVVVWGLFQLPLTGFGQKMPTAGTQRTTPRKHHSILWGGERYLN